MASARPAEKRTSAAKAVKRAGFYGTAEPVPFVRRSLPQPPRRCPNGHPKNLIWTSLKISRPNGTRFR
jgi:hypothetical protein